MTSEQETSKTFYIILWIVQVLLAITFIWAGAMKLFNPSELPFPWVRDNETLVKLTGILDLLAGIGFLLPTLLRIQPQLTIYASYGTIALMVSASVFHISRGEVSQIGFNIFVAFTSAFIAWGRQKKSPITSKNK